MEYRNGLEGSKREKLRERETKREMGETNAKRGAASAINPLPVREGRTTPEVRRGHIYAAGGSQARMHSPVFKKVKNRINKRIHAFSRME